ncbi:hypothetical protein THAOC_05253 [Thalassiosira oceanica]|uniref:Uncharacterized protein n=1 Tax=Thalassiosira oceanica TaxID=159749 RepID=K0THL1_THAOC|nr:hypothetical protein THAOC_05253 [Thalassiosira oceanica]|eukprot:EJK73141.1 hypothetical protein THAOC_05253 [Thalassiosira oceanica]
MPISAPLKCARRFRAFYHIFTKFGMIDRWRRRRERSVAVAWTPPVDVYWHVLSPTGSQLAGISTLAACLGADRLLLVVPHSDEEGRADAVRASAGDCGGTPHWQVGWASYELRHAARDEVESLITPEDERPTTHARGNLEGDPMPPDGAPGPRPHRVVVIL